jgi:hypothetical protein
VFKEQEKEIKACDLKILRIENRFLFEEKERKMNSPLKAET